MTDQDQGAVLAVGLDDADLNTSIPGLTSAETGRAAIEMLRLLRFDLVLTADHLPDMPLGQFIKQIRTAWPWQKWALFSRQLTNQDEITARTLGVMHIIEGSLDWDTVSQLVSGLRSRGILPPPMPTRIPAKMLHIDTAIEGAARI